MIDLSNKEVAGKDGPFTAATALSDLVLLLTLEGGGLALLVLFLSTDSVWLSLIPIVIAALFGMTLHYSVLLRTAFNELLWRRKTWAYALGAMLTLLLPFYIGGNTYIYNLMVISMLFAVVAVALNFQLGSANLPNFASGASYGIGAYAGALLMVNIGLSFWPALVVSAVIASFFGLLLGIPCMRTRDYYLALVTIAYAVVIDELLNNLSFTGGSGGIIGIPAPSLFGYSFTHAPTILGYTLPAQANFYWLALVILIFSVFIGQCIHNSRVGLAWNAIGADTLAASCQGINVVWYKVLAFMVDAFLASLAGTTYAAYTSYIAPSDFTFVVSVTIITMVIVGGRDNVFGAIAGAFILIILPEKFRIFSDYRLLLYAVSVIGVMLFLPKGLIPRQTRRY